MGHHDTTPARRRALQGMKGCTVWGVAALVLLLMTTGTEAKMVDGQQLLHDCQENLREAERTLREGGLPLMQTPQTAFCGGYVIGVVSGWQVATEAKLLSQQLCLPEKMSALQGIRVVVRYLQTHPAQLHMSGARLVVAAHLEAFPCAPPTTRPQR